MLSKRKIYFNEAEHKYTDDIGNVYTSATTLLGKYHEEFNELLMAKRCAAKGVGRYKGKNYKQIIKMWADIRDAACDKGNTKHNYLETSIKQSSNFVEKKLEERNKGKLYAIHDILIDHDYGRLDLKYFVKSGVKEKYPTIFNILQHYSNNGWKIYAEIGVFWEDYLLSGLVDVLLVKGTEFIIVDWKTNKDLMPCVKDSKDYSIFKPGYMKRDNQGGQLQWMDYKKYMLYPVNDLYDVNGIHYTLQLSLYAFLIELHGLKCKELILCHIVDHVDRNYKKLTDNEIVEIHRIKYVKPHIDLIVNDYLNKLRKTRKLQTTIELWN